MRVPAPLVSALSLTLLAAGCAPPAHLPAHGAAPHWSYHGEAGPEHWAQLSPLFALCDAGREQSPVDLAGAAPGEGAALAFDYAAHPPTLVNNGHTVQVNVPAGSSLSLGSERYELLQYHFHAPSEHTVAGARFPLEMHLVHRSPTGLAVVGVLVREGREHPAWGALLAGLPAAAGEERTLSEPIDPEALLVDPGESPGEPRAYRYPGSLTTPPCSEAVRWQVLARPVELSPRQIEGFRAVLQMNARPVQPLNGRTIVVGLAP